MDTPIPDGAATRRKQRESGRASEIEHLELKVLVSPASTVYTVKWTTCMLQMQKVN
jgi:hypothetical protein